MGLLAFLIRLKNDHWLLCFAAIAVLCLTSCGMNPAQTQRLAVTSAFGQFTGLLLSSNYQGAYEMMSSDYKAKHSISGFTARDEAGALTRIFTRVDWSAGAKVILHGDEAEFHIKYNASFGSIFYFRLEQGRWRFTDRIGGFESF